MAHSYFTTPDAGLAEFEAGDGSVLHQELVAECGRLFETFQCSVVVSTRIRSCPVVLCCFGIFLLVLTRSRAVMF